MKKLDSYENFVNRRLELMLFSLLYPLINSSKSHFKECSPDSCLTGRFYFWRQFNKSMVSKNLEGSFGTILFFGLKNTLNDRWAGMYQNICCVSLL